VTGHTAISAQAHERVVAERNSLRDEVHTLRAILEQYDGQLRLSDGDADARFLAEEYLCRVSEARAGSRLAAIARSLLALRRKYQDRRRELSVVRSLLQRAAPTDWATCGNVVAAAEWEAEAAPHIYGRQGAAREAGNAL